MRPHTSFRRLGNSCLSIVKRRDVHWVRGSGFTDDRRGVIRSQHRFASLLICTAIQIRLRGARPDGEMADVGCVVDCALCAVIFVCSSISYHFLAVYWKGRHDIQRAYFSTYGIYTTSHSLNSPSALANVTGSLYVPVPPATWFRPPQL